MAVTFDVAVIGGGITGLSAALAATQRGGSVCLVRGVPGATALSSGAWSGPLRPEIRDALSDAGYSLVPAARPLPHQRGDLLQCDYAGSTHVNTDGDASAVCGIAGLGGFNARSLARLWERDRPLQSMTIELPQTPAGGWAPVSLAAFIEKSPESLMRALGNAVGQVILPPVLGHDRTADIVARFADAGITVTEALAATPSIPGWRMLQATARVPAARNIRVFEGRAVLGEASNRRVTSLRVGSDTIHARSFVLATGKYLAGGITATDVFAENVFALPIWLEHLGDVFTSPDALPLTDPVRSESQPLMFAGVHTDEMSRPVNRAHDVVYENVFVAGTIRAGWNAADSGLGHCAEDGWTAGVNASS